MSLPTPNRMLVAAREVEYEPSRNWLQFNTAAGGESWAKLSTAAQSFLYGVYDRLDFGLPLLCGEFWEPPVLDNFEMLSPDARTEVLLFETLVLHELTHRVDYTHSVHGAAFRVVTIQQAIALLQLWPKLLANNSNVNGVVSKWDADQVMRAGSDACDYWDTLKMSYRELVEYFQVLPAHRIASGWSTENRNLLRLPMPSGEPLEIATLSFADGTNVATVLLDSNKYSSQYLRPAAVVEGRALCHAIRHLALRFQERPMLALQEISRYLGWAAPSPFAPDYRFLLDVVARHFGAVDLDSLIANELQRGRLQLISLVAAHAATTAWVALGGLDVSQRLIACICAYPECYKDGREVVAPWVLAARMENFLEERADRTGTRWNSAEENLQYSINNLRALSMDKLPPGIHLHSERMVEEIKQNLENRLGNGHICDAGFPNDGNPIDAYRKRQDIQEMVDVSNVKWAMVGVDSWFLARRSILGLSAADIKRDAWESLF